MKFIDRLMGRTQPAEQPAEQLPAQRAITRTTAPALVRDWAELPGAGVSVTVQSALSIPTVFAALSSVADTISTLPLPVYRQTGGRPVKDRDHKVYRMLNVAPNPYQTPKVYRASMALDLMIYGEHFSEIRYDSNGEAFELYRIDPGEVSTQWVDDGKGGFRLEYRVQGEVFEAPFIMPITGFSLGGIRGDSPLKVCQNSLSMTLALDQYGGSFVRQGCRFSGILKQPHGLTPEELEEGRQMWVAANSGTDKAGKVVSMPDGYEFHPMNMSPEDSQFHDSRIHQMREAQRVTRTPPYLSNDYERQTWNNIQHARMVFVEQSVRPLCVSIEQAINKCLLGNDPNRWAEHVVEGILRGSFSEQITSLSEAIASGIYTVNEARELFNLPPLDQPTTNTTDPEVTVAA